jgi:hypothetical protein
MEPEMEILKDLNDVIERTKKLKPESRKKNIAITKMETAMLWLESEFK